MTPKPWSSASATPPAATTPSAAPPPRALRKIPRPTPPSSSATAAASTLLDDWEGYDTVIIIDAAAPTGHPGRIHRLDLATQPLPPETSTSTHGFGLAQAIHLATALGRLPPRLIIYAVEANSFAIAAPLSQQAASALPELLALLDKELGQNP